MSESRLLKVLVAPLVSEKTARIAERIAEVLHPVEVLVHLLEHLGEAADRFHAGVPVRRLQGLLERGALQRCVLLVPAGGLDDLERVGRRHEHLRHQRIRIERHRRHHLFELFL